MVDIYLSDPHDSWERGPVLYLAVGLRVCGHLPDLKGEYLPCGYCEHERYPTILHAHDTTWEPGGRARHIPPKPPAP